MIEANFCPGFPAPHSSFSTVPMTLAPRFCLRGAALVALVAALAGCSSLRPRPAASASLYERLGRYDGIAAVIDDFLAREMADARIAPFFRGLEPAELRRIRQHLVEQFCAAAGGPCYYHGRDMKTAHAELEITEETWNTFTGHLDASLRRFKVGERERNELVVIIGAMKQEIVNKN